MRLKVKELEIISPLVPLILVVVLSGAWLHRLLEVLLEADVRAKLHVFAVDLR